MPDIFLIYFLTNIGPAHYTYNIQLTKKIILTKKFVSKFSSAAPTTTHITKMCSVGGRLPPRPPSLPPRPPREYTSTPLAPRKSAAVDDLIAVAAAEDSSRHRGEVAVATHVGGGIG